MRLLTRGALGLAVIPLLLIFSGGTAQASTGGDTKWDRIAKCESSGKWNTNTGNGYQGGLQFSPRTWRAFGGSGSAHKASRAQQIKIAERVLAKQGWKAWPACSKKLGFRRG